MNSTTSRLRIVSFEGDFETATEEISIVDFEATSEEMAALEETSQRIRGEDLGDNAEDEATILDNPRDSGFATRRIAIEPTINRRNEHECRRGITPIASFTASSRITLTTCLSTKDIHWTLQNHTTNRNRHTPITIRSTRAAGANNLLTQTSPTISRIINNNRRTIDGSNWQRQPTA